MPAEFAPSQRVMVSHWKSPWGGDSPHGMNGYYGHVVKVDPAHGKRHGGIVDVQLIGRIGHPARPDDLDGTWPLYADELEHAD